MFERRTAPLTPEQELVLSENVRLGLRSGFMRRHQEAMCGNSDSYVRQAFSAEAPFVITMQRMRDCGVTLSALKIDTTLGNEILGLHQTVGTFTGEKPPLDLAHDFTEEDLNFAATRAYAQRNVGLNYPLRWDADAGIDLFARLDTLA